MPSPVDADELAFVNPLLSDAGRREREEAAIIARAEANGLERDAYLLFAMPDDDLPDEFLEGPSSSGFGLAGVEQESELSESGFGRTSYQSPVQCMGGWPELECDISDGYSQSPVQLHPGLISADSIQTIINDLASREPEVNLATNNCTGFDSPYLEVMPMSSFVPRNIPDPFGEIPAQFDEERVRACEADIVYIREFCVQRGIRGLGLRNVPELALTMSTVALASAPVTPHCTWWPPVAPVEFEPRAPQPKRSEPSLPIGMRMRMRMRMFMSDLGRAVRRAFVDHEMGED